MPAKMTLGEMAKALNRPAIYLTHLQKLFELPIPEGAIYPPAYFDLLRKIVHLRALYIAEDTLIALWKLEKHLMQLLHFDSTTGSPTWYLDECGKADHPEQRLLLTNLDLGPGYLKKMLQPRLDFATAPQTLFSHKETGDNALEVLKRYSKLYAEIQTHADTEAQQLRNALRWFPRIRPPRRRVPSA